MNGSAFTADFRRFVQIFTFAEVAIQSGHAGRAPPHAQEIAAAAATSA
jgi:hypothetical protein